jgi:hypothetical protein
MYLKRWLVPVLNAVKRAKSNATPTVASRLHVNRMSVMVREFLENHVQIVAKNYHLGLHVMVVALVLPHETISVGRRGECPTLESRIMSVPRMPLPFLEIGF